MGIFNSTPIRERYQAYLLIILFVLVGNISIAQQQNLRRDIDTNLKISQKKATAVSTEKQSVSASPQQYPITISKKAGEQQIIHDEIYFQREIRRIDLHMDAIDKKRQAVNADPEKKIQAINNGWYDQMSNTEKSLREERERMVKELERFQK
jgi:hypothetical protein